MRKCAYARYGYQEIKLYANVLITSFKVMYTFSHVSIAQNVSETVVGAEYKSHSEIKFTHTFIISFYLDEKLEPSNHPN